MAEVIERRVVQPFPLYYDLYVPEDGKPKPLIIALHGYGGDKSSMMRLMRRILRDGERDYIIACPQGPHQHLVMPTEGAPNLGYGFGWLSNFKPEESVAMHHQLIREIIETLTSAGVADASRVFLLGFSQAAGANFRFAFTHGDLVRGVVAICGGIPAIGRPKENTNRALPMFYTSPPNATNITRRTGCGGTPRRFALAPDRSNCGSSTPDTKSARILRRD